MDTNLIKAQELFNARVTFEICPADVERAGGIQIEILIKELFPTQFEIGGRNEDRLRPACRAGYQP